MVHTSQQVRDMVATSPARLRTLAEELKVTEAALLAAHVQPVVDASGRLHAQVLQRSPLALPNYLPMLGPVMMLTRHQSAVSEVTDTITDVQTTANQCVLHSATGDWVADLDVWQVAFVVQEQARGQLRSSIQIFDTEGTAIVKVYAVQQTQMSAWQTMLQEMQASTDIHWPTYSEQIAPNVPITSISVAPSVSQALRSFLSALTEKSVTWLITVTNRGMQQTYKGSLVRFVEIPDWFNYLDPNFNLHLAILDCAGWVLEEALDANVYAPLHILNAEGQTIVSICCISPLDCTPTEWEALIQQHLGSTHFRSS